MSNFEAEKTLLAQGIYFEGRLWRGAALGGNGGLREVDEIVAM